MNTPVQLEDLRRLSEAAEDSPEDRDAFTMASVEVTRALCSPDARKAVIDALYIMTEPGERSVGDVADHVLAALLEVSRG